MTSSFKKRPHATFCNNSSQKEDKQRCNRIMRRWNRKALKLQGDDAIMLARDEALNRYSMAQDGSRGYRPFDPQRHEYRQWFRWVLAK